MAQRTIEPCRVEVETNRYYAEMIQIDETAVNAYRNWLIREITVTGGLAMTDLLDTIGRDVNAYAIECINNVCHTESPDVSYYVRSLINSAVDAEVLNFEETGEKRL